MLDTAMILAAGRGERMRPLTDTLPKPLLNVGGKPLIVWHLEKLARAGFKHIVINHAWLGDQLEAQLGDGRTWGLSIQYSPESSALETAGGIVKALPLLGQRPFLVVNGDIFCDFPLSRAHSMSAQLSPWGSHGRPLLAWCVMVGNAAHHPTGDFAINNGLLVPSDRSEAIPKTNRAGLTFSGIAIYHPAFFAGLVAGTKVALRPVLESGITREVIGAEYYAGRWLDIGTPERLAALDRELQNAPS
jgi:N-acetyl-alpha-D-muramate 1-phosphate uridylyltransferase